MSFRIAYSITNSVILQLLLWCKKNKLNMYHDKGASEAQLQNWSTKYMKKRKTKMKTIIYEKVFKTTIKY